MCYRLHSSENKRAGICRDKSSRQYRYAIITGTCYCEHTLWLITIGRWLAIDRASSGKGALLQYMRKQDFYWVQLFCVAPNIGTTDLPALLFCQPSSQCKDDGHEASDCNHYLRTKGNRKMWNRCQSWTSWIVCSLKMPQASTPLHPEEWPQALLTERPIGRSIRSWQGSPLDWR